MASGAGTARRQQRGAKAIAKELSINEQVRAPRLRVIRDGDQLGVMTATEAQRLADEAGLDLVEIAPTADPPVCRIMDYGKYKYEQAKRERESRRGSKNVELREVRMRVKIDQHDIDFKARTTRKLLAAGDKVKVSVMFRAREITHPEVGRDLLDRFFAEVSDAGTMERSPSLEGRFMTMVLEPAKRSQQSEKAEKPARAARADSAAGGVKPEPAEQAEPVAPVGGGG
ncbi:MAG: translation initiation factor IF-3 [Dehalococcoidia bacterium]|nr:translation initiation factor IF-3 [Dehalococcoidia bacterium]